MRQTFSASLFSCPLCRITEATGRPRYPEFFGAYVSDQWTAPCRCRRWTSAHSTQLQGATVTVSAARAGKHRSPRIVRERETCVWVAGVSLSPEGETTSPGRSRRTAPSRVAVQCLGHDISLGISVLRLQGIVPMSDVTLLLTRRTDAGGYTHRRDVLKCEELSACSWSGQCDALLYRCRTCMYSCLHYADSCCCSAASLTCLLRIISLATLPCCVS